MIRKILERKVARQQELIDAAQQESRSMTDAETAEFDALQADIEELKSALEAPVNQHAVPENAVTTAVAAERQRAADITALCRDFGMDPRDYINSARSLADVQTDILTQMRKSAAPVGQLSVERDEGDKFRDAAAEGLYQRAMGLVVSPTESRNEYRGMSIRDLGIECLVRAGGDANALRRMNSDELYTLLSRQFTNPSAAFPAIMDSAIKKSIVEAYNTVPTTWQDWCSIGTVTDFKATPDHEYLLGGVGDFELVPQNGELKHSTPSTSLLPSRKIDTYGKQFSMSRQAFINDDIGFVAKTPAAYTAAAKKTIDKAVYKILCSNPVIFDGVSLFHNTHANLVSIGAAPEAAAIQEIILLAQEQTDPFGDPIYQIPRKLIVPVGHRFALKVAFGSTHVVGSGNNDINPLYDEAIDIIESPFINQLAANGAVPWFLTTDAKSIQVDFLNGQQTPSIRRGEPMGQLGFVWDIWLDWGVTAVDFRGIYKNVGV